MKRPYKRIPRYFMDEIDAALDFRNVSIIANYIKDRTKNAQFIIISLRNHMSPPTIFRPGTRLASKNRALQSFGSRLFFSLRTVRSEFAVAIV